ncbi:MAG TPA: GWxTD domain-containing protein [Thermoanaerobaculia bacterium]|jgi:GWxTD domain-containing protein|nr:GWxTD domain-containing protein [Thermoanaerobaculia bacterium]
MRKLRIASILFLLFSTAAGATLSEKYKSWDKSPEAYFLTSEEKAKWKNVKTDNEAEKFVVDYFARREPDLKAKLAERIAVADKYFSAGKVKGSETLRGKVIIVFGPPSQLDSSGPKDAKGNPLGNDGDSSYRGTGVADPLTNVGPGASGLRVSAKESAFAILYDERAAPPAIGKAFRVQLKMISAARQEAADPVLLEEYFEKVAKASIKSE